MHRAQAHPRERANHGQTEHAQAVLAGVLTCHRRPPPATADDLLGGELLPLGQRDRANGWLNLCVWNKQRRSNKNAPFASRDSSILQQK